MAGQTTQGLPKGTQVQVPQFVQLALTHFPLDPGGQVMRGGEQATQGVGFCFGLQPEVPHFSHVLGSLKNSSSGLQEPGLIMFTLGHATHVFSGTHSYVPQVSQVRGVCFRTVPGKQRTAGKGQMRH